MIRMMRVAILMLIGLGLLGGLSNCGGGDDTIRIAVAGPMTGSGAAFGEMISMAAKLKEKEINDAGGITLPDGTKKNVEFVIFDDKGETTEANSVARKIAADDSFVAVVGHFNSNCSLTAKKEYNRVGIVEFSPGSTNVKVCVNGSFTFRNLYRDDYQGQQIAMYLKDVLSLDSVAVLYDNDDYGKGLMTAFADKAGEIGLEVTARIDFIRERTQDFKPRVQEAKESGAQSIFVAGLHNEAALIATAARSENWDVPIIGGDGVMSQKFIELAGAAAEGAFITTPFLFNTGDDSPEATAFLRAFKAANNKEPDTWAALTYDACGQILAAISAVGTDRTKIRDHLAATTTEDKGYLGVTGVTYFDNEGDCYSKKVYVAVVRDGVFVPADVQMR